MDVIIHAYVEPNLKKLVRNKEFDCTTCGLAKRVKGIDCEEVYLCRAALYDLKTLACHVPANRFYDMELNDICEKE